MNDFLETDVIVVGAGPSGVPAAVAAARQGAKVVLLEEDQTPGGGPVDMYVTNACGSPRTGIYAEMLDYLNLYHTLDQRPILPFNAGEDGVNHWWMPYAYLDAVMVLLRGEPNITLLTGATVQELICQQEDGVRRVLGVRAQRGYGQPALTVRAPITIDATGTGLLGELAGCDVRFGSDTKADFDEPYAPETYTGKIMPCTLMYLTQRLHGTSIPPLEELDFQNGRYSFMQDKQNHRASTLYEDTLEKNVGIYLHWGPTVQCTDTRDPMLLGTAYLEALDILRVNERVWQRHGYTLSVPPRLGVRECRRVMGEKVLTLHDMMAGTFPQDTVAISRYGVDLWEATPIDEQGGSRITKPYGIPYGALLPKGTDGLLMAGKSISGSRFACSSYRVQPIVAAIGEAAGTAAGLCTRRRQTVRGLSVTDLQAKLTQAGSLRMSD